MEPLPKTIRLMKKLYLLITICMAPLAHAAVTADHPSDSWEIVLESGYAWNVGSNTSIDYEIVPTQLTLRSPTVMQWWEGNSGERLIVRTRVSLLMESFTVGPETGYLGIAGAPSIEYWFPNQRTSAFFSIGGGIGLTDSTNVIGGQGQDFTLNWFSQLGIRHLITEDISILGSAYFIHHSNGGQTSPNPGIDALGFTVGHRLAVLVPLSQN